MRCILQLADDMRPGQFPIGGPDQPTYDEVLDTIGEGLGKRHVRKLHLPVPFFAVQARLLSLLPSPPLTPAALELFASDNTTTDRRDRAAVRLPAARLRGARAPRGPLRLIGRGARRGSPRSTRRRAGSCAG